jgi:hypothetical protein
MVRVPAQRKSRRARGGQPGVHAGIALLIAGIVATQSLCAEPIALGTSDIEARLPGSEAPPPASPSAPPSAATDESATPLAVPSTAPGANADLEDAPPHAADGKAAGRNEARVPQPQPAGSGRPASDVAPAGSVRHPQSTLAITGDELAAEEPVWESEIKEAIRPIYDDLAASGIIDAVQGFRSYLAMLGVYLSNEHVPPPGDRARPASVADPQVGAANAGWEAQADGTDALTLGKTQEQIEKEKLIAAMIVSEWFATILPWIYGALALIVAWQVAKLTFAYVRARSTRAQRRSAKRRHRSADSARARARS